MSAGIRSHPSGGKALIQVDGSDVLELTDGQTSFLVGSQSDPSITFVGDTDTGLYRSEADGFSAAAGGLPSAHFYPGRTRIQARDSYGATSTGGNDNYRVLGDVTFLSGQSSAFEIYIHGTVSFSSGGGGIVAGGSRIMVRMDNSNTLQGAFWSESGGNLHLRDVGAVDLGNSVFRIYVRYAGNFACGRYEVSGTGVRWADGNANTGTTSAPGSFISFSPTRMMSVSTVRALKLNANTSNPVEIYYNSNWRYAHHDGNLPIWKSSSSFDATTYDVAYSFSVGHSYILSVRVTTSTASRSATYIITIGGSSSSQQVIADLGEHGYGTDYFNPVTLTGSGWRFNMTTSAFTHTAYWTIMRLGYNL